MSSSNTTEPVQLDIYQTYMPSFIIAKNILSVIVLIPYGMLFFVYGFRARFATLAHKFAFQLFLGSIFYSISFLFPSMTPSKEASPDDIGDDNTVKCIIQGAMNIFGEMSVLFFTSAIAVFTYFSYTRSHTLSRNFFYIILLNIICWVVPLIFVIIIASTDKIKVDKTRTCWFDREAEGTQAFYFTLCGISFLISCVFLFRLKYLIKKDLIEDDNLEMYPRFVKRINIQIFAQFATYVQYLIWLIFDKMLGLSGEISTGRVIVLGIAEIGEIFTGIVIPLCYGFSKEFYDEVMRVVCCKPLPGSTQKGDKNSNTSDNIGNNEDEECEMKTATHLIQKADEETANDEF